MLELDSASAAVQWLRTRASGNLQIDNRQVVPGDVFVAWPGVATDGRRFVQDALSRGASACLVERQGVATFGFDGDAIACIDSLKAATGPIASLWYGKPTDRLDLLAVTGTNGKTSTVWWLAQAMSQLPDKQRIATAMVGTLGIGVPSVAGAALSSATGLTTPDPVTLQREFRRLADAGLVACAMEASSIGLAEHRLDGSRIRVAVFTNFSHDHLDYHGSMAAYWKAKSTLFDWTGLQAAVINVDDEHGAILSRHLGSTAVDLWTVSSKQPARLVALDVKLDVEGLRFTVSDGSERHPVNTTAVGAYNVSNLLCVIGAMRAVGVTLASAARACQSLAPVPGRMQRLGGQGQPLVVVDFAHTADALDQVLQALRPLARTRGGVLWCVFGCGGDRDRSKRAPMGAAAERMADRIVVTSDNPRSEDPQIIVDQVLQGFSRPERAAVEVDRACAISGAITRAASADVICIAGKGHETYQEASGIRHPFSDVQQAEQARAARAAVGSPVAARTCA